MAVNRSLVTALAAGLWILAAILGGASLDHGRSLGTALVRPLVLPFLWRTLDDAKASGDSSEVFAKARLLLEATPGWADGYLVFTYKFALDGGDLAVTGPAATRAAYERLQTALAVLEAARSSCPGKEVDLLSGMAFLVELAARRYPAITELLGEDPVQIADRYLAVAESLDPHHSTGQQRLFLVPLLCGALLRAGDRRATVELLDAAIDRGQALAERPLVADWLGQLDNLKKALLGDPTADRAALADDPRLETLTPYWK